MSLRIITHAFMGAHDDFFRWDVGDASDIVEGGSGFDGMLFNGSDVNEVFVAAANGSRLSFKRDAGNVVMDTNDVERVVLIARGGTDSLTINDLSATDVKRVDVDLTGVPEGTTGDGAADTALDERDAFAHRVSIVAHQRMGAGGEDESSSVRHVACDVSGSSGRTELVVFRADSQ
jgi:hypothetical protein